MRTTLFILGAVFEGFGIVLVASPDLVPGAIRFAAWLRPRMRVIENRLRRLLRLPLHVTVHAVAASGTVGMAGSVSATKSTSATTLKEKVEFLLRRDQEAQRDVNTLRARVRELEAASPRRLDELRRQIESHISNEITSALEDFRTARIGDATALAIGLALTTAASLL